MVLTDNKRPTRRETKAGLCIGLTPSDVLPTHHGRTAGTIVPQRDPGNCSAVFYREQSRGLTRRSVSVSGRVFGDLTVSVCCSSGRREARAGLCIGPTPSEVLPTHHGRTAGTIVT